MAGIDENDGNNEFVLTKPAKWNSWLSLAKYWYEQASLFNSNEPYQALYGISPSLPTTLPKETPSVAAVEELLLEREDEFSV